MEPPFYSAIRRLPESTAARLTWPSGARAHVPGEVPAVTMGDVDATTSLLAHRAATRLIESIAPLTTSRCRVAARPCSWEAAPSPASSFIAFGKLRSAPLSKNDVAGRKLS